MAGTTVHISVNKFKINQLQKMYNDIDLLDDKIDNYYIKFGGLPIVKDTYNNPITYTKASLNFKKDVNDNENYYIIDLSAIGDITLNYGQAGYENPKSSDDVYIVNEKSHIVYYIKGIKDVDGTLYHSKGIEESINENTVPPTKPEINIISQTDTSIDIEIVPGKDNTVGVKSTVYTIITTDFNKNETTNTEEIVERKVISNLSKDNAYEITAITTSNSGLTSENNYTINEYIKKVSIGDYVNYDPTKDAQGNTITGKKATYTSYSQANSRADRNEGRNNGYTNDQVFNLSSYTGGWRVLGIENGKLQLISEDIIGPDSGGNTSEGNKYYYLQGDQGYIYGEEELNAISSLYGQGKYATGARSINVDDINNITGYKPESTGNGKPYASGTIYEYGNKVTYSFNSNNKVTYKGKYETSAIATSFTSFKYYDENSRSFVNLGTSETKQLTSTNYSYYPTTLTTSSSGDVKGIKNTSEEWKLLFANTSSKYYWLASSRQSTYTGYTLHVLLTTYSSRVDGAVLLVWGSGAYSVSRRNSTSSFS